MHQLNSFFSLISFLFSQAQMNLHCHLWQNSHNSYFIPAQSIRINCLCKYSNVFSTLLFNLTKFSKKCTLPWSKPWSDILIDLVKTSLPDQFKRTVKKHLLRTKNSMEWNNQKLYGWIWYLNGCSLVLYCLFQFHLFFIILTELFYFTEENLFWKTMYNTSLTKTWQ